MSTIIFQISKYVVASSPEGVVTKEQLRLKERYNDSRDQVTAMATLHMLGETPWLKGMHYCFVDENGERFFSFNKAEGVDFKTDFAVNFNEYQLKELRSSLQSLGALVTNPIKDENGVSQLRGYQLHIELLDGVQLGISKFEDPKFGDRLQMKANSNQIKSVKLVKSGEAGYVTAPDQQQVDADILVASIFEATKKEEKPIETKEEAKAAVMSLMSKAQKRGANRQAARGAEQVSPSVKGAPSAKIVLADDEDDEQPA